MLFESKVIQYSTRHKTQQKIYNFIICFAQIDYCLIFCFMLFIL